MSVTFEQMPMYLSMTFLIPALVFFSLSWVHRDLPALPFWTVGFASLLLSTILIHLRGANPPMMMQIIPNTLIAFGYFCGLVGLRIIKGSHAGWTFPIAVLVCFIGAFLAVVLFANTPSHRVAAVSLGIAAFSLCVVATALTGFGRISLLGDLLIVQALVINAIIAVLRAGAAIGPADLLPLSGVAIEKLFFLWSIATPVSTGTAFFLPFQAVAEVKMMQRVRTISRLRDELEHSLAEQEGLKQILVHELRRPLNQIATTLEARTLAPGGALVSEDVGQLKRLVNGAGAILDEISDLIELRELIDKPDRRVVPIAELGEDIAVKWAVPVAMTPNPKTGEAFVDLMLFDAAVGNVVANGLRHGGSCRVALTEDARHLVVDVIDNGPGIPPEDWGRVWDQFTQLDAPVEQGSGRIGVGLFLARRIARAHGGDAIVLSQSPSILRLTFRQKEPF